MLAVAIGAVVFVIGRFIGLATSASFVFAIGIITVTGDHPYTALGCPRDWIGAECGGHTSDR